MSRHRRQASQALPLGFSVVEESSKPNNVGLGNVGAPGPAAAADGIDSNASAKASHVSAPSGEQLPRVGNPTILGKTPSQGTSTEKH